MKNQRCKESLWLGAMSLGLLCASGAEAVVEGVIPEANDRRFDAVAALGRADLLGQDASATAQHDWHCSATLVTEELVIGAKQCIETDLPIDLYTLRFRRRMDEGLGTVDEGAGSFFHVRLSEMVYSQDDFFVAKTEYPVPHITPIPVAYLGFRTLTTLDFWQAGWGKEGPALDEGQRKQLKLCRNRLSATDDELFWMTTFDSVGGHTCGLNTIDVGGPAIYEEGNTDKLFIVGIATDTRSGVNLHRFSDDDTFPLSHEGWSVADAAVEHPAVNSSQILPGERLEATIYVVNAGAPSLPAGTRLIAHLMGNTVDYNEEALLLDSPYAMPVPTGSEAYTRIFELSAFPSGSYRIRWAMGPGMGQPVFESFVQNNVIFSPYFSLAPRFASSQKNYVGTWTERVGENAVIQGAMAIHRRTDDSIVLAAWTQGQNVGIVNSHIPLDSAGNFSFDVGSFANQQGTLPSATENTFTHSFNDDVTKWNAQKLDEPDNSSFAAGLYRGDVFSDSGGRVLMFLASETSIVFAFDDDDVRGTYFAAISTNTWSIAGPTVVVAQNPTQPRSVTAQLSWDENNEDWVVNGQVFTQDETPIGFQARIEWEPPTPTDWFESCASDWDCEDGMSMGRARCFTSPAGLPAAYCTLPCSENADCAQGICQTDTGMCAPTCDANVSCPAGWNCAEGSCIPGQSDGGVVDDAGVGIDAGGLEDAGSPDAGSLPNPDAGVPNDPPQGDAGSTPSGNDAPSNSCGGCATNASSEWLGYGFALVLFGCLRRRHRR